MLPVKAKRYFLLLGSALLILSGCFHRTNLPLLTQTDQKAPLILIQNAVVFTGNPEEAVLEKAQILIQDGKIARISPDEIQAEGAVCIDATGKSVIPGLIDAHVHTCGSGAPPALKALPNSRRNATAFLYAGITTVVDTGGPPDELQDLAQDVEAGVFAGPRLYYSGKILTAKQGHPAAMFRKMVAWPLSELVVASLTHETDTNDDIAAVIRENKAKGGTFTKIVVDQIPLGIPSLDSTQVARIVEAAQKEGQITMVHIGTETDIRTALAGGARLFIHGPYRSPLSDETIAKMQQADSMVVPTLAVFDNLVAWAEGKKSFSDLDQEIADPVILAAYTQPAAQGADPDLGNWVRHSAEFRSIKYDNVIKMKAAGIPLIAGSDSSNVASFPGATLHRELELLVDRCGFTPLEAVASATYIPGKLYPSLTGQPRLGYLHAGLPADLVILNGDFRKDIRLTQKIHTVISRGKMIRRLQPELN